MKKFCAYILKSEKDGKYYYGSTSDINKRLKKHNAGGVPSTKSRSPMILHYSEIIDSKREALSREKFFKSIDGYNWLKKNKII